MFCVLKVNSYPTVRGFTAIGTGGEDFVHAMVVAVESVIQQPISQVSVSSRFWKLCFSYWKSLSYLYCDPN